MISKQGLTIIATLVAVFVLPPISSAAPLPPRTLLLHIYQKRPDLQRVFDAKTWAGKKGTVGAVLGNLENWARRHGHEEYPDALRDYRPQPTVISKTDTIIPKTVSFPEQNVTAESFVVIDQKTNTVLLSRKPELLWPLASLTKLATALAVDASYAVPLSNQIALTEHDDVGGGKIYTATGSIFSGYDLFAAMLVGSANNAATALARAAEPNRSVFIETMNTIAKKLGATQTAFVDPSGMEVANMGTAIDIARISQAALRNQNIRELAGRARWTAQAINEPKPRIFTTTNWLLYDSKYNDLYVVAGKTGYLDEAKWNLTVILKPMHGIQHELLVVTLGSAGRRESFDDSATLARWTWKNFTWK